MLALPGFECRGPVHRGSVTSLCRAVRISDGTPVVIRVPNEEYPSPATVGYLRRELEMGRLLKAAAGTGAVEWFEPESGMALIHEDCGGWPLDEDEPPAGETGQLLGLCLEMAGLLERLHFSGYCHHALRPSSFWVDARRKPVRLSNLALARSVRESGLGLAEHGACWERAWAYLAPELTGRLERKPDPRSDLYSFGAIMHWIFTGAPPFQARNAMEWIHAHLAREPSPPSRNGDPLPGHIAAIIAKLLAKAPENRYQSAHGLRADLEDCRDGLRAGDFVPGGKDVASGFRLQPGTFGREAETRQLAEALDRACSGDGAVSLLSGEAGIGKSTLALDLKQCCREREALFASGKFDKHDEGIPYSAFLRVFRELLHQTVAVSAPAWSERFNQALGGLGKALTPLVPDLEMWLGPQPGLPEAPPMEARNRLDLAFLNFMGAIRDARVPFVIFLDDLHWADAASIRLFSRLAETGEAGYSLLIGSYRRSELEANPEAFAALSRLESGGAAMRIALGPMRIEDVNLWLSVSLGLDPAESQPFAEAVYAKAGGNPFSIAELVGELRSSGLLRYAALPAGWVWDLRRIRALPVEDGVASLLAGRIQELPPKSRAALQAASFLGRRFESSALCAIEGLSHEELDRDLLPALAKGFLSRDIEAPASSRGAGSGGSGFFFAFVHDRIRQACLDSVPAEARSGLYWRTGRALHALGESGQGKVYLIESVQRMNQGRAAAESREALDGLVDLNVEAGNSARASGAFELAYHFYRTGLRILGEANPSREAGQWEGDEDRAMALTLDAAEAACLSARYEEADRYFEILRPRLKGIRQQAKAYETKILSLIARDDKREALRYALEILAKLGVRFPERPGNMHALLGLLSTRGALAGRSPVSLSELPIMREERFLAATAIFKTIYGVAYLANPKLFPLVVFSHVSMSLKHGNSAYSCTTYAGYGIILAGVLGNYEAAYRFGELSLRLLEDFQSRDLRAKIAMAVYHLIFPWKIPLRGTLPHLQEGRSAGLESGDLEFASYLANAYSYTAYHCGMELGPLREEIRQLREQSRRMRQARSETVLSLYLQSAEQLMGLGPAPAELGGAEYAAPEMLGRHVEGRDGNLAFLHLLVELIHLHLFRKTAPALACAARARSHIEAVFGLYVAAIFAFHESLVLIEGLPQASRGAKAKAWSRIRGNRAKLRGWARHAPGNYAHKLCLVEAEMHRARGKTAAAWGHYDKAASLARSNGYMNDEALAAELAARFHLGQDRQRLGTFYLREADYAYRRWGALAKAEDLRLQHAHIIAFPGGRAGAAHAPGGGLPQPDFISVLKASQAISTEIVLDKLLRKMMEVVVENAGADRGFLIMEEGGKLWIKAGIGKGSGNPNLPQPLDGHTGLPVALIRSVAGTGGQVMLQDAPSDPVYRHDPYIERSKPRSVLCLQMVHRGTPNGILYLENAHTPGAFTEERLQILTLLSSQAAISITNAQYHAVQLEAMQSKIKPHFLFNALSSIADLVVVDPKTAETAIVRLSQLYRYVLTSSEGRMVALEQELDVVRAYLALEKLRFGNRLRFQVETSGETGTVSLPGLLIQPLVENSIRHGIAPKMDPGTVNVLAEVSASRCRIIVEDDGEESGKPSDGTGFGLRSVQDRLQLTYGDDFSLGISREKGYRVEISIPIARDP